ncbi:cytochrome P450 [Peniophora sp. CONT]|nr:cytochrome P450 [Peniophora sp. CONT]
MSSRLSFYNLSDDVLRLRHERAVLAVGILAGIAIIITVNYLKSPWRRLPPGPPGLPIIGNAFQLVGEPWSKFSAWRKEYGDIIYLNAAGQPTIVANSHKVATELLDRRAGIYSDRPPSIVAGDIMTDGLFLALARYGDLWRRMRKAGHESLNKAVAHNFHEYQSLEALLLARDTLTNPAAWDSHLRRAAASMVMACIYDEPPLVSEQDPRISHISEFTHRLIKAASPGAHWVEMMPLMRHIPSRFAAWKRAAEESRKKDGDVFCGLYEHVQDNIAKGDERPSICATLALSANRLGLSKLENSWIAATMYVGGFHTTYSSMSWWSYAMLAYPEYQQRVQDELDVVVGRARVPTFADLTKLPYTSATVKEILRWSPMTPVGVPHRSIEDDYYNGYFIPKGSIVIPNVLEMNHDKEVYGADAGEFNPARHLDKDGKPVKGLPGTKDENHHTFGFGRRICLGRHIANDSLFIDIATCLWAFSFTNPKDQVINMNALVDEGLTFRPKPFEIKVIPRFPEALKVLSVECELRRS